MLTFYGWSHWERTEKIMNKNEKMFYRRVFALLYAFSCGLLLYRKNKEYSVIKEQCYLNAERECDAIFL